MIIQVSMINVLHNENAICKGPHLQYRTDAMLEGFLRWFFTARKYLILQEKNL